MTFQIKSVVIYSLHKKRRVLDFKLDQANIIQGRSKSGKTALIDVLDYCFGAELLNTPDQPVWRTVEWFSVLLQFADTQVFIARKRPKPSGKQNAQAFMEVGKTITIPEANSLKPNTNIDTVISRLSRFCGIESNFNERPSGVGTEATLRHALWLCFLSEDEIATRAHLFHKQNVSFHHNALKDTLPFFIASHDATTLQQGEKLRHLRREYLEVTLSLRDVADRREQSEVRARSVFKEAQASGLAIAAKDDSLEEVMIALQNALDVPQLVDFEELPNLSPEITSLRRVCLELREKFDDLTKNLQEVNRIIDRRNNYLLEKKEQLSRLQPLRLVNSNKLTSECPICDQKIESDSNSATSLLQTFYQMNDELTDMARDTIPHEKIKQKLLLDLKNTRENWSISQKELDALIAQNFRARESQDLRASRSYLLGRIDMFVKNYSVMPDLSALKARKQALFDEILKLETEQAAALEEGQLFEALSSIDTTIRAIATHLKFDYSDASPRLDLNMMTIVAERERLIPFSAFGSSRNYLAYHIATYLALHKHFILNKAPVPNFIFFDQPSRPFYPNTNKGMNDSDTKFLKSILNVIVQSAKKWRLQVIVTEQADFDLPWFNQHVNERWNGKKLIPTEWVLECAYLTENED